MSASQSRSSSPRSVARVVVLGLLIALGFVAVGTVPASAADGEVSWAVKTASNDFGEGRQNYRYTLDPGGHLKDALVVVNHGEKPLTLKVYAADGFTTDDGQLDLETADTRPKGVGVWLHAAKDTITIKPGKSARVPFTVEVPKNATPGDHMGGIITSLAQDDDEAGINVDRRLAVRVRLRVSGDLKPAVRVEDLSVDYDGTLNPFGKGDATVSYTIHNTGNAIVTVRQKASVSGPFGMLRVAAGTIEDSPELLPGDSWKVSAPVHGAVPTLLQAGNVTLTPLMTDASGTTSPLPAVTSTAHTLAIPWTTLLLIALLIAAAVAVVRGRRAAQLRQEARVNEAIEQALRDQEETSAGR